MFYVNDWVKIVDGMDFGVLSTFTIPHIVEQAKKYDESLKTAEKEELSI